MTWICCGLPHRREHGLCGLREVLGRVAIGRSGGAVRDLLAALATPLPNPRRRRRIRVEELSGDNVEVETGPGSETRAHAAQDVKRERGDHPAASNTSNHAAFKLLADTN
jgi:hypothetical protein